MQQCIRHGHFGVAVALGICAFLCGRGAEAQELITNGDFETGSFAGWAVVNERDPGDTDNTRDFYLDIPGSDTPDVSGGFFFPTAGNATGGDFYAVTTSDFPGETALIQTFTTPALAATGATLTFQLFASDQSGSTGVVDPSGLDYTTGGTFQDNQHARVDLLAVSETDFSTTVIRNFYLGADPSTDPVSSPNPYTDYSFDLTGDLLPGTTYKLRFAEVDNLSAFNLGVDNVSLSYVAVPESPTLGLFGIGGSLFALAGVTRRTQARRRLSAQAAA